MINIRLDTNLQDENVSRLEKNELVYLEIQDSNRQVVNNELYSQTSPDSLQVVYNGLYGTKDTQPSITEQHIYSDITEIRDDISLGKKDEASDTEEKNQENNGSLKENIMTSLENHNNTKDKEKQIMVDNELYSTFVPSTTN